MQTAKLFEDHKRGKKSCLDFKKNAKAREHQTYSTWTRLQSSLVCINPQWCHNLLHFYIKKRQTPRKTQSFYPRRESYSQRKRQPFRARWETSIAQLSNAIEDGSYLAMWLCLGLQVLVNIIQRKIYNLKGNRLRFTWV